MLFNSLTFLAFFAAVLAIHYSPLGWTTKKGSLLLASYLFYAAWNPPFVVLIWLSTVVDWYAAKWMFRSNSPTRRRGLLIVSLCTNLGLLAFFKYSAFVLENFVEVVQLVGVDFTPVDLGILLPVGISFYTFQTLSYTIDVYRRQIQPADSALDFALFVTFFPQLVAGPIVRASDFLPQLVSERGRQLPNLDGDCHFSHWAFSRKWYWPIRGWRRSPIVCTMPLCQPKRWLHGSERWLFLPRSFLTSQVIRRALLVWHSALDSLCPIIFDLRTLQLGSPTSGKDGTFPYPVGFGITCTYRSAATEGGAGEPTSTSV
jgi:hypothetical protein